MEDIMNPKIEIPKSELEKGRGGGHMVQWSANNSCWTHRAVGPNHSFDSLIIDQREAEENIVRARREYENARARLLNLEKLIKLLGIEKENPGHNARLFSERLFSDDLQRRREKKGD